MSTVRNRKQQVEQIFLYTLSNYMGHSIAVGTGVVNYPKKALGHSLSVVWARCDAFPGDGRSDQMIPIADAARLIWTATRHA
jgi:hypothetical protein